MESQCGDLSWQTITPTARPGPREQLQPHPQPLDPKVQKLNREFSSNSGRGRTGAAVVVDPLQAHEGLPPRHKAAMCFFF